MVEVFILRSQRSWKSGRSPPCVSGVYPRERTLGLITLVLGLAAWIALIAGTFGVALVILSFGFVAYLFAQSALITRIKGNGVQLSDTQFPDLYAQYAACCDRLQIKVRPDQIQNACC